MDTIRDLPPYVFVMLGLYVGLRREEILALQWDCVFLDEEHPYLSVRRAWHTEHNRPVITTELKTPAARRDIPIPPCLVQCLKEAKEVSSSAFVIANGIIVCIRDSKQQGRTADGRTVCQDMAIHQSPFH